MKKAIKFLSAVCLSAMLGIAALTDYYSKALPDSYLVTQGNPLKLSTIFDITTRRTQDETQVSAADSTSYNASLTLFDSIPIKQVSVTEVERPVLVAGGNPFGIKLHTKGVIVVDFEDIVCGDKLKCPAKDCGITEGDIILSVNGVNITSNRALQEIISKSEGRPLKICIMRDGKEKELTANAVFCTDDDTFKTGMYTRDSSAGIGTLTFFNPQTNEFAGLGHAVCDADTGDILPLDSGEVVSVSITGFTKGHKGTPGELKGTFTSAFSSGILKKNCKTGVYGTLNFAPNLSAPLMLGFKQEAELGKATMLTTIDGSSPKEYEIEIEKIDFEADTTKNMVIKVTDPDLLEQTGGILQGMSGSPIIQNGRLIGAVTHVFVNDPTRGYAIFAETMQKQMLD